jgi:hypothetical protein
MVIKPPAWQKWLIFWLLALSIALGLNYQNRHLTITQYKITDQRWPAELNNWRVVQLSDLHNQVVAGSGNRLVLKAVKNLNPGLIVLTGDTFDSRQTNIPANLSLISQLRTIAPVYLIFGNHDFCNDDYVALAGQAEKAGAIVLRNQMASLKINGQTIALVGLDDPTVLGGPLPQRITQQIVRQKLAQLISQAGEKLTQPIILLAHRPELWPEYLAIKPIAILSGHTHGGQIRLPLAGALYVPNQKLWPDYDQGDFIIENSQLIISRGLGNSSLGQRFNAYPEIISLDFNHQ